VTAEKKMSNQMAAPALLPANLALERPTKPVVAYQARVQRLMHAQRRSLPSSSRLASPMTTAAQLMTAKQANNAQIEAKGERVLCRRGALPSSSSLACNVC